MDGLASLCFWSFGSACPVTPHWRAPIESSPLWPTPSKLPQPRHSSEAKGAITSPESTQSSRICAHARDHPAIHQAFPAELTMQVHQWGRRGRKVLCNQWRSDHAALEREQYRTESDGWGMDQVLIYMISGFRRFWDLGILEIWIWKKRQ